MMIKLEKDASLIYTVNHEEYAKFIADLKSSSRHEIGELTQDFLNLELHPNTRDLAGLAAMVNGEKEKGGVGKWNYSEIILILFSNYVYIHVSYI